MERGGGRTQIPMMMRSNCNSRARDAVIMLHDATLAARFPFLGGNGRRFLGSSREAVDQYFVSGHRRDLNCVFIFPEIILPRIF